MPRFACLLFLLTLIMRSDIGAAEEAFTESTNTSEASTESTNTSEAFTESTNTSEASTEATNTSEAFTESTNTSEASTESTNTSEAFPESTNTSEASTEATNTSEASTEATNTSEEATAEADSESSDARDEARRRRGIGSSTGGGITSVQIQSMYLKDNDYFMEHVFNFPTLELSVFLMRKLSLEFSIPIVDAIVQSIDARALYFDLDVFVGFHFGSGNVKFILAPGVGVEMIAAIGELAILPRIPLRFGVEVLTPRRRLGVRFMTRPFVTLGYMGWSAREETGFTVGGGVMGEIAINFYRL